MGSNKTRSSVAAILALIVQAPNLHAESPAITVQGFLDGYYSYNTNRPPQGAANNAYRYYDTEHNQMTLNLAELTLKGGSGPLSFAADLDFGPFANLNGTVPTSDGSEVDETNKTIGQAVVIYRPEASRWTFEGGKMYSHLGVETVKSKDNFNYSRSTLFSYALPFWHLGLRVAYEWVPTQLQTSLYVYNGWNTQDDINQSKTLGAQVKYAPVQYFTIIYNFIGGAEQASNEGNLKVVHELNGTFAVNEKFALISDLAFGSEENVTLEDKRRYVRWYAGLIAAQYKLSTNDYASARIELYRDEQGYTLGTRQSLYSVTLTSGHQLTREFSTRIEARHDQSSEQTFVARSGLKSSQLTLLIAGLLAI